MIEHHAQSAACRLFARRAVAITAILIGLTGCGYSHPGSFDKPTPSGYRWHSLYRDDVQTVAVPIFTTRIFDRGLEFRLSKSIINNLEAHSPYKVVSRERADTVLEGEIVLSEVDNLSRNYFTNVPQEQLRVITVNFRWKDLRTGRLLVDRKNFQQTASWYPTAGENQWTGDQLAVERLALGIIQEMQADW